MRSVLFWCRFHCWFNFCYLQFRLLIVLSWAQGWYNEVGLFDSSNINLFAWVPSQNYVFFYTISVCRCLKDEQFPFLTKAKSENCRFSQATGHYTQVILKHWKVCYLLSECIGVAIFVIHKWHLCESWSCQIIWFNHSCSWCGLILTSLDAPMYISMWDKPTNSLQCNVIKVLYK